MTELLLRLFVKDYRNTESTQVRSAIGAMAGFVGMGCNVLLFALKLLAGTLAGSVSITADALNNLSDASGSIVTLVGFKVAGKPADEHHPYGHARAEYVSALGVAVLILFIGLELAKTSLEKIFHPVAVEFSPLIAAILLASIGTKLWMSLFNHKLSKRIDSAALAATSADSRNDCIATAAVLLAGLLESFLGIPLDGWMGLGVAGFILFSGWGLARDTVSMLLGQGEDPTLREKILDYIAAQPQVLGYHDLMVHDYGPGRQYASLHVEMDHREDPLDCHERIDDMERECLRSHGVHLVIHYDPVVTDDPELIRLKEKTAGILKERDARLTLHDFRMVPGRRHMNLVFDVPIPLDLRGTEQTIRREIEDTMNREGDMTYHVIINYDMMQ